MKSKIGDRSVIMKGVNNITAIAESRASALNNDNYSPQRDLRCIDFERLQKIGEGVGG